MKLIINNTKSWVALSACLGICLFALTASGFAQNDSTVASNETEAPLKVKPVKNTFQSVWIIDNQTVMVPVKHTLEMDIMHRFGVIDKGYRDFWGFFAPSDIRLGINYSPINNLNLGIGITKINMMLDGSAKYAIIKQTKGKYPVSVTYYGNVAINTKKNEDVTLYDGASIKYNTDKLFFFNQLIIARKITNKLSVQIAPSVTHQNAVGGYYTKNDSTGKELYKSMKNDHFAIAFSARYKLTNVTSVMVNYDQPLTKHPSNNPNPNLSFGVEFNTSSHSFQVFLGNYYNLNPQQNNLFNHNNPFKYTDKVTGKKVNGGQFLIGFNITRLWNY
jgi:Membrane bound beta barrel domain (DUF5777)